MGSYPVKMVKGRRWVLKHHFDGVPKAQDFELVEEELPELKDGQVLVKALWLSVDPYMRPYTARYNPPITMIGEALFKVLESKNEKFLKGSQLLSNCGWVDVGILDPSVKVSSPDRSAEVTSIRPAPSIGNLSPSLLLGACGMTGNTAYFGLLEPCKPKAGETVVVNGAAGAVGSMVGQIAKIKGCRVIGFAGTDKKCETVINKYRFDKAYNYNKVSVSEALDDGAPNGVDCFFDNVGGDDASIVINHMNPFGRIAVCGAIATYNDKTKPRVPMTSHTFVFNQLKMEGFLVTRWLDRWEEGIKQMATWVMEGKIQTEETVVEGFERMPDALIGLFTGSNKGKMVVK